jgi:hypothetical protein
MTFSQLILVSEQRVFSPDEQKRFCDKVYNAVTFASIRCVVLDQIISLHSTNPFYRQISGHGYEIDVIYEISSESVGVSMSLSNVVDRNEFKAAAATAFDMDVSIEAAQI